LHIDSQVLLVPSLQRWSVFGLEKDATDASDSPHVISGALL
jgi:hypothetical protein